MVRRKFGLAVCTLPSMSNSITVCDRLMASILPLVSAADVMSCVMSTANLTTL